MTEFRIFGPVQYCKLSKTNKSNIRKTFKKSFRNTNWADASPYPTDNVIYVKNCKNTTPPVADRIVGFLMYHTDMEQNKSFGFEHNEYPYIYNLCVQPQFRNNGMATAMIERMKELHSGLNLHHIASSGAKKAHDWFTKRGFIRGDVWRVNHAQYTWEHNNATEVAEQLLSNSGQIRDIVVSPYYDQLGNFFYLN
jgi:GNAT superfamily N-acetyltransferase